MKKLNMKNIKQEIKENLYQRNPDKYEEDPERLEYEAELKLQKLADEGNEEAIKELSRRAF